MDWRALWSLPDRPDASKAAFAAAVEWMRGRGLELVDCQVETEHLKRFGAREIPRAEFLGRLRNALATPAVRGRWTMEGQVPSGDGQGPTGGPT